MGRPKTPTRLRAEADVLHLLEETRGVYKPSLRNAWYKVVHYVRAQYPNGNGNAHFIRWVTEMRKAGVIPDDAFTDEGRGGHHFHTWDTPDELLEAAIDGYYPTLWEPGSDVEVWCESNSTATQILPTCERWRVHVVPLSGFSWQFARDQAHRVEHWYGTHGARVLYLGDHDASGYLIELQARQHLGDVAAVFTWERLALLPDQARSLPEVEERKGELGHTSPEWEGAYDRCPAKVELEAFDVPELLALLDETIASLAPTTLTEYEARTEAARDDLRERIGME